MCCKQMILEKRATRQVERRVHVRQQAEEKTDKVSGDSNLDKVNGLDKECRKKETEGEEGDGEKKSVHNKTDHPETQPAVAKPVPAQEQALTAMDQCSSTRAPRLPALHILALSLLPTL